MRIADLIVNKQEVDWCGLVIWSSQHGFRVIMNIEAFDPIKADVIDLSGNHSEMEGQEVLTASVIGAITEHLEMLAKYSYAVLTIQDVIRRHGNPVGEKVEIEKSAYENLCQAEELVLSRMPEWFLLQSQCPRFVVLNERGQYVLRDLPEHAVVFTESVEARQIESEFLEAGYPLTRISVIIGGTHGIQKH